MDAISKKSISNRFEISHHGGGLDEPGAAAEGERKQITPSLNQGGESAARRPLDASESSGIMPAVAGAFAARRQFSDVPFGGTGCMSNELLGIQSSRQIDYIGARVQFNGAVIVKVGSSSLDPNFDDTGYTRVDGEGESPVPLGPRAAFVDVFAYMVSYRVFDFPPSRPKKGREFVASVLDPIRVNLTTNYYQFETPFPRQMKPLVSASDRGSLLFADQRPILISLDINIHEWAYR